MYARKIIALLALAALGSGADSVYAGSVIFRIPLDVKNYAASIAVVWCELRSAKNYVLGGNAVDLKISGGATPPGEFIEVKVNYLDGDAPSIQGYRCALLTDQVQHSLAQGTPKAIPPGPTSCHK